jgi:imidazolonepropionase-like amidohydrolase
VSRLSWLIALVLLIACGAYVLLYWPLRNPHPHLKLAAGDLAVKDVKIYPLPDAPPIEHGTVLMEDGVISAVGERVAIPAGAKVLSCKHCVLTAGFWNAHIHFTEPKWNFAAWTNRDSLNAALSDMLTSRGFTTVVDTGSDLRSTVSLRRRIETGDLSGPFIYTAGMPLYPPKGIPYYLKNSVPAYLQLFMPQPASPEEAAQTAQRDIDSGADLVKLFTGSYVERGKVQPMPEEIARAAVGVAHRNGSLVYSHASNLAGTQIAIQSRVDVLAHAPDTTEGIDESVLREMVSRRMAMVPTLKMFATTGTKNMGYLQPIYDEVRQFYSLGGQLLFGTDVGYMTDYATEDEFRALTRCGLQMTDVLRMLTLAPAIRFGVSQRKGTVAPGKLADVVVLDADPAADITAFSKVHWTIRSGRVLYSR